MSLNDFLRAPEELVFRGTVGCRTQGETPAAKAFLHFPLFPASLTSLAGKALFLQSSCASQNRHNFLTHFLV